MNQIIQPGSPSDVPWPTSVQGASVPDAPLMAGSDNTPAPAVTLLRSAAQGAHDTIDRLADSATPAAQQLGDSLSSAAQTLHETSDQLQVTKDEWVEDARVTVRNHPLLSVAAAVALGVLMARLAR